MSCIHYMHCGCLCGMMGGGVVNVFVSPFFVLITFDAHEDILCSLETKL